MGKTIYTIGYGRYSPEQFLARLKDAGVTVVLDVRRKGSKSWNGKYNQGLAMGKLMIMSDIKYGEWDSLGNNYDTLAAYCFWLDGKRPQRTMAALTNCVDWGKRVDTYCLLCAEGDPFTKDGTAPRCHRVYVADALVKLLGSEWSVVHL